MVTILGEVGSAVGILSKVWDWLRGRRRLEVSCSFVNYPNPVEVAMAGELYTPAVRVRSINPGPRPVGIESVFLRMSDGGRWAWNFWGDPLPAKLEEHEPHTIFFGVSAAEERLKEREEELGQTLVYKEAVVEDVEGQEYTAALPPIEGLTVARRSRWQFWR